MVKSSVYLSSVIMASRAGVGGNLLPGEGVCITLKIADGEENVSSPLFSVQGPIFSSPAGQEPDETAGWNVPHQHYTTMEAAFHPEFWFAVGQIIMIDILLGGDNAVVIALACRNLPPKQRKLGILWGTVGAIALRVLLISFALTLLTIPFLKLIGGMLLLWIGIKLLLPEEGDRRGEMQTGDRLLTAIKTVIVADFVMSLDNVIAIAGSAESAGGDHKLLLVIFGLMVSIPIIVWGSQLVIRLMDRFPFVITLGGMLLGWIAGEMAVSDPLVQSLFVGEYRLIAHSGTVQYAAGTTGALLVLFLGLWFASLQNGRKSVPIYEHVPEERDA